MACTVFRRLWSCSCRYRPIYNCIVGIYCGRVENYKIGIISAACFMSNRIYHRRRITTQRRMICKHVYVAKSSFFSANHECWQTRVKTRLRSYCAVCAGAERSGQYTLVFSAQLIPFFCVCFCCVCFFVAVHSSRLQVKSVCRRHPPCRNCGTVWATINSSGKSNVPGRNSLLWSIAVAVCWDLFEVCSRVRYWRHSLQRCGLCYLLRDK